VKLGLPSITIVAAGAAVGMSNAAVSASADSERQAMPMVLFILTLSCSDREARCALRAIAT
jgi:hypothetical protein